MYIVYDIHRPLLVVDGTRHARLPMPVSHSALAYRSALYPLPMLRSIWLISDLKRSSPPTTACTILSHSIHSVYILHMFANWTLYYTQASALRWPESKGSNGCSNVVESCARICIYRIISIIHAKYQCIYSMLCMYIYMVVTGIYSIQQ